MSVVGEASLVLGLISSAITVFEAAQEIYEAARDVGGLPKKFRAVAEQIPLIHHALDLAKQNVKSDKVDEQGLQSARPVLERCAERAAKIRDFFKENVPGPEASRSERLRKAMGLKMKSRQVKDDMEEVVKDLELLAQHQIFQDAVVLDDIRAAVEQLSNLSDEEAVPQFVHSGAGAINANTGLGQQQNYVNSGSGSQYNAEKQFFGRDQAFTASERGFLTTIGPRRYIDIQERVEGTCVWSTETVEYRSWVQSSRSSILWITGSAGTGKTTLTNYLIEHIKERSGTHCGGLALCSFFCSRDIEGQHDVGSILQDLVLQLVEHSTDVLRKIKAEYGMSKQDHPRSFESIWRMFESTVRRLPSQHIYVVIDALDECDETSWSRLFKKLARLLDSLTSSASADPKRIKLVISGQPRIRKTWDSRKDHIDHYHIDIEDGGHVAQDILLFVEDKVSELIGQHFCSEKEGRHLQEHIASKSENSFLWLTVVLEQMKSSLHHRSAHLVDILSQMPQDLQHAYAGYLPHVNDNDTPLLQCYLRLLVASSRPLRIAEIEIFSVLHPEELLPSSPRMADDRGAVKASIERALGSLVRFPYDTAQFVHSTAKDFFVLLAQQPKHHLHTTHGTDLNEAHLFCFRSCMKYLLHESVSGDFFDIVTKDSSSTESDSPASMSQRDQSEHIDSSITDLFGLDEVHFLRDQEAVEEEACLEVRQRLQAYDYSATNWAYHLAKCEILADDDDVRKAITMLSLTSGHLGTWYTYLSQQSRLQMPRPSESSPIVLAAMFNLPRTMTLLYPASQHHLSPQDLSSALYWAASRGSIHTVKLLLDHGAPVSLEQVQRVPLAVAARGNFSEICGLLLAAAGVNPNQIDHCGQPALNIAAEMSHLGILRLLLSHALIDVNLPDLDGRTALMAACRSGSIDSIRVLRQDGRADVNMMDLKGQTCLHHASKNDDVATINELVGFNGINLGMVDKNGRNAISIAAQAGHFSVVRKLHHFKMNAATPDRNGRNALSWAANSSKATEPVNSTGDSVLEYLVRKYPDEVDVPDESGWTPLAWALDAPGYVRSVLTLTRCSSVDVNRRDETGGKSILAWAASAGMTEIVQCLLRRTDLEVDQPSFSGQTALSYAASNGMMNTVKLLLQMGNASSRHLDHYNRTPADWAEMNGFMEVSTLLRATAERAASVTTRSRGERSRLDPQSAIGGRLP